MIKHLVAVVMIILLAVSVAPSASASTDGSSDVQRTRKHDMIWQGLCVGASLDLSFESQVTCAKTAQSANNHPVAPPSIATGLCVGASLDLSRASQAKCARQVRAAQQKPDFVAATPNIEAGLCVGASLDLSRASQIKCVKQTQDGTVQHKHVHSSKHQIHTNTIPASTSMSAHQRVQYAALGDSVAGGLGLPNPIEPDGQCGRSFESYAYTVASSRGLTVANFACKGAKMSNLSTQQSVSGPNLPPQLDSAFAGGTPDLITITAGANDVHWQDFLAKCFARICGTSNDDKILNNLLSSLELKTQFALQDIQQRSGGSPPQVILTGYYMPVADQCTQINSSITLDEISWLNSKTTQLNQTLQSAADQSGYASFVPIDFTGHDICSSDPWVQSLNDPAPFHPTAQGQQAIASAIL